MTQYASGAISPLGALIMKRLLLALAALFALFVVPAFADVPYVQGCLNASTGWLTSTATLTQYNSGAGPLGLTTPNGAPYCVITNTSTVTTVRLCIEQIQLVIWRRIVVVVNVLKGAEKLDFLERVDG